MNINEISRFMSMYMMNSIMNSSISSIEQGQNNASIGQGQNNNFSNSMLFEYMLNSIMGENDTKCCEHCTYNKVNLGNNNDNNIKKPLISSDNVYGVYGDFYPMGKAPGLKSRDINISPRIDNAIKDACKKYGVEESFIRGIIKQESDFNPNCKSGAGAMGLMQLMSYNCTEYGVRNPYNIEDNINGGVKYIGDLLGKFNGNKQLALSAYNGGITRMRNRGVDTVPEIVKMPKETVDYVSKVMGYYNQYKEIKYV